MHKLKRRYLGKVGWVLFLLRVSYLLLFLFFFSFEYISGALCLLAFSWENMIAGHTHAYRGSKVCLGIFLYHLPLYGLSLDLMVFGCVCINLVLGSLNYAGITGLPNF